MQARVGVSIGVGEEGGAGAGAYPNNEREKVSRCNRRDCSTCMTVINCEKGASWQPVNLLLDCVRILRKFRSGNRGNGSETAAFAGVQSAHPSHQISRLNKSGL